MARYVLTQPVTVPGSGYGQPPRVLPKGTVVELSASEVTAITAVVSGSLRAGATAHDALGESFAVSN